jgi:hypothetical protein
MPICDPFRSCIGSSGIPWCEVGFPLYPFPLYTRGVLPSLSQFLTLAIDLPSPSKQNQTPQQICYKTEFANKCEHCYQEIPAGEVPHRSMGKKYHKACFKARAFSPLFYTPKGALSLSSCRVF